MAYGESEIMAYTIVDDAPTPAPKAKFTILEDAPSPLGSNISNFAAGAGKAVMDMYRGLKQRGGEIESSLVDKFAPDSLSSLVTGKKISPLDAFRQKIGLGTLDEQRAANQADINESRRLDAPLMGTKAGVAGNIAGNVAATYALPMGGLSSQMAIGAGLGAMQPTVAGESPLTNMAAGAGGALAGNLIARGAARIINPQTSPTVKTLLDEGVSLTPGQVLGGAAKATEEKLSSVPVLGDFIKNAQGRGIEDFNRAAYNRALEPIGETAGKNFPVGREGMALVKDKLGAAYDALLPKLSLKADDQLGQDIKSIKQMVQSGLPPAQVARFDQILRENVVRRMTPQGNMSGDTFKIVESDLSRLAKGYKGDSVFDNRQLGDALAQLQVSLRDNLARNNPAQADALAKINEGYANFTRLRRAASSTGSDMGVFTPAQLAAAVKAGDSSVGKGNTAIGEALMQDLSDAGKKVISNKYPDSGTVGRGLLGYGIGAAAGSFAHPAIPLAIGAGAGAYTRPAQAAISAILTKRPEMAVPISELLRKGVPLSALTGAGASTLLSQ
jgi:hypothetical protein